MRTPLELENLFRSAYDVDIWTSGMDEAPAQNLLTAEEIDFVARAIACWAAEHS